MRSTHALGAAVVALIQERDFDAITVQQILDRAGVARATFYAHFRNKDDVLHSSYERLFEALEPLLARAGARDERLFPVAEFLAHVAESGALVDALHRSGQLAGAWSYFTAGASRVIERRLARRAGGPAAMPPALTARMLAGALMEALAWWRDHQSAATPAQMDAAFHRLARSLLGGRSAGTQATGA